MTDRERFESAIAADRCDSTTRLIFADFLEENGFDDEAVEQRRCASPEWVESARFMEDFASRGGQTCDNYDGWADKEEAEWRAVTFEEVVQAGHSFVLSNGDDYYTQHGEEGLRDLMYGREGELYWKHWGILTDIETPEYLRSQGPFSCSC